MTTPWSPLPALLPGASMWLRANDANARILDGTAISQLTDLSGSGRHATGSGATRPTLATLDDIAMSNHNGSSQFLSITGGLPLAPVMTLFEVFRRASSGILSLPLGGSNNNAPPYGLNWFTDNVRYSALTSGTSFVTHGSASTATGIMLTQLTRTPDAYILKANGATVHSTSPLALTSASLAYVGRRGATYHAGGIVELLCIPRALTTAEEARIQGYLAHRYGVAAGLPAEHPYRNAAPLAGVLAGSTKDSSGTVAARRLRIYDHDTGALVAALTSAVDGTFSRSVPADNGTAYDLVFDGEPDKNALILATVQPA